MKEVYAAINGFIVAIVKALTSSSQSVENLVASANHGTAAIRHQAQEIEEDTKFSCLKAKAKRKAEMSKFEEELEDLTEPSE